MKRERRSRTDKEIIEALGNLYDEIELETDEEADAILREAGYDPHEVGNRLQRFAAEVWKNSRLNWRNQSAELNESRKRIEALSTAVYYTRAEMERAAQDILALFHKPAAVHFRNYEEMTDEELAEWLQELQYLLSEHTKGEDGPQ